MEMEFDRVHPDHRGENTVHMTRMRIAEMITGAGHKHVLDLPCGTGALSQMLLDRGLDVVSADLNPDAFLVAGRRSLKADLNTSLPFQDGEFDAMACIEGIEHIENPHLLAREANRILRPNGMLYVSTPNILNIRSRISYLLRGYPNQFHYMIEVDPDTGHEQRIAHINPVGYLEMRYVLSSWGFHVEAIETNRLVKRRSLLYALVRAILMTRGRRNAAASSRTAEVRRVLLSDTVLFGEALIVGARKVAN